MFLWKKESTFDEDCLIDLFSSAQVNRHCFESFKLAYGKVQKNDMDSVDLCKRGNELYQAGNWTEAIEQYNKSVRFAGTESENLGLAYVNRSACFFQLSLYANCLTDIKLARNAKYPQDLCTVLDDRETKCLEFMKESKTDEMNGSVLSKLSFVPSEKYPGLADILGIQSNDEFGKHVVAKCDIDDVGKIVMLEDVFVFGADCDFETVCKTCAKRMQNFIPCPMCADVMFCNAKCMESNNIHRMICGALCNRQCRHTLEIESILIAVSTFPNAESLMKFVESALETRDFDTPDCKSDSQTEYRSFLKLLALPPTDINTMKQQIFDAYEFLLDIPLIREFFNSKQHRRFLMHLIGQHLCILSTNAFGSRYHPESDSVYMDTIGILTSLFNHSCAPNTLRINYGNKMIAYTLRPVKMGEQLFINYAMGAENLVDMQRSLHFQCKCSKCVPRWEQDDRIRMKSDPNYLFITHIKRHEFKDHKKRSVFMGKLQNLLMKYGRLPWSPEFEIIECCFEKCCMEELHTWDY